MELYFVRHGETDVELDEPLNKSGIQQAQELARQLKEIKFDAICSPRH